MKIYDHCFPFISSFPPPTVSPPLLRPLCSFFLITLSHEAPLPPWASPWPVALRDFAGTNTPCIIPCRTSASRRSFCYFSVALQSITNILLEINHWFRKESNVISFLWMVIILWPLYQASITLLTYTLHKYFLNCLKFRNNCIDPAVDFDSWGCTKTSRAAAKENLYCFKTKVFPF